MGELPPSLFAPAVPPRPLIPVEPARAPLPAEPEAPPLVVPAAPPVVRANSRSEEEQPNEAPRQDRERTPSAMFLRDDGPIVHGYSSHFRKRQPLRCRCPGVAPVRPIAFSTRIDAALRSERAP